VPRVFKIAAIQMDASPAPVGERLKIAGQLAVNAAKAGARLVVLPELFNTGYDYAESNYPRACPFLRTCCPTCCCPRCAFQTIGVGYGGRGDRTWRRSMRQQGGGRACWGWECWLA
jgi:predicted amidohydrolase